MPSTFSETRIHWRRLDGPGHEHARMERSADGWRLSGDVVIEDADVRTALHYVVDCDAAWCTRSATVEGNQGPRALRIAITREADGRWRCNDRPVPAVDGAIDVDLGFTPATNTLPIRRLGLAAGATASVSAAWLRYPGWTLERLEQTYRRESPTTYRYGALVDGDPFAARLEIDALGRVVRYAGLWEAEGIGHAADRQDASE